MSATDYTYDERDLKFLLFEQLKIQDLLKLDAYKDFEKEDFDMIVSEAVKFATGQIGPTNREGDEVGAKWEDGEVRVPPNFKPLFKAFREGGWISGNGDPEYGAQGLPHVMGTALADIFTAANTSFFLYSMLAVGVAHVLEKYGPDWMKKQIIPKLYDGTWGGTMVLTEAGAGTDVGASKTKAEKVEGENGLYRISGAKIFITGGDQDLTENIIHLVLARTPDAPPGTKGLSIFIVPKIRFDENDNLTDPNDVSCVGIEHKMGIIGSATCQLSFGDKDDCLGWIIGNEGDGIRIMFNMMNSARIEVGLQGCSTTNAAYRNALSYARERIQGPSINEFKNPAAPKVPIIEHPDVRRMLLTIKAFGEGMRSLLCYTSYCGDIAHHGESEEERDKHMGFLELLTPICKAYCTDRGVEMTSLAIQVYGGYGYTKDYPVEQYMRDVKIGCLYEGTNSIQALDLMGRKLAMKRGAVFMSYLGELDKILGRTRECSTISDLADEFSASKDRVATCAMTLGGWGMQKRLELATSRAVQFLDLMGDVVIASELLKGAAAAEGALLERLKEAGVDYNDKEALAVYLNDSPESSFYHGKIMNARFFINNILPRTEGWSKAIINEDLSHLEIVL